MLQCVVPFDASLHQENIKDRLCTFAVTLYWHSINPTPLCHPLPTLRHPLPPSTTHSPPSTPPILIKVLLIELLHPQDEYYVAIVMDRVTRGPVLMASGEGGVDIEEVADRSPGAITKEYVDPLEGTPTHMYIYIHTGSHTPPASCHGKVKHPPLRSDEGEGCIGCLLPRPQWLLPQAGSGPVHEAVPRLH